MENLPCNRDAFELVTSIEGQRSRLRWLIELVKHVLWAEFLYFLYLLLL